MDTVKGFYRETDGEWSHVQGDPNMTTAQLATLDNIIRATRKRLDRLKHMQPEFVDFIPDHLEAGKLYISRRYATAIHLCACGCGNETVTPIKPDGWQLAEADTTVSLTPSIGNFNFPCKSHYFITENNVVWAG